MSKIQAARSTRSRLASPLLLGVGTLALLPLLSLSQPSAAAGEETLAAPVAATNLQSLCQAGAMQAVASTITSSKVTVTKLGITPQFAEGTRYVAASGEVPAYCQVTGRFVTNPATGKTAGFLATFPANWNGKYLQLGCSGHCGNFAVSNPASRTITVTNQGYPNQIIIKGYATFATDEGHEGMEGGIWAVKGPGEVNDDAIIDYLYRADKVLTKMGKAFTLALYGKLGDAPVKIKRSYFSGCSGGGRDAMVAASYFPEEFDGIIAGSPYNPAGRGFHIAATSLAPLRLPDARVSSAQLAFADTLIKTQCDALDGVKDGLIQNPAACNFRPERDLPLCKPGETGAQCFTKAQRETLSVVINATTDEQGRIVQPGYSLSELQSEYSPRADPKDPGNPDLWPDDQANPALWSLANGAIRVMAHRNDPNFRTASIISYRSGGPGQVTDFHSVVPRAEVTKFEQTWRLGIGHYPENAAKLIRQNRKLMIWHNFSDEKLTPFNSVNYYNALAKRYGGYTKLQKNVRMFALPGTGHCGAGGVAPNNFDAIGAMEDWVEKGKAPEALPAALYDRKSIFVDPSKTPLRTMPLCKFPEQARYSGKGDVNDGRNWHCPAGDRSMLKVGESGRQAGVTI